MEIKEFMEKYPGIDRVNLGVVHHFSKGLYARQMHIPAGAATVTHAHTYSHLSILASGKVAVRTDEETNYYQAPACIEIKADVHHMITAIEDSVWFCIHATDETDAEKIDEVLIRP